jgi:hypothetical protein
MQGSKALRAEMRGLEGFSLASLRWRGLVIVEVAEVAFGYSHDGCCFFPWIYHFRSSIFRPCYGYPTYLVER